MRANRPPIHTYAVEWSAAAINFYVDDNLYETQTPTAAKPHLGVQPALLHHPECPGRGDYPGAPSSSTTFPQTMKVDWVRVYEPSDGG